MLSLPSSGRPRALSHGSGNTTANHKELQIPKFSPPKQPIIEYQVSDLFKKNIKRKKNKYNYYKAELQGKEGRINVIVSVHELHCTKEHLLEILSQAT